MQSRIALSKSLKIKRKLMNQTLTAFSEELGIGRSTLCSILAEDANPTIDLLDHMAERLDMPPHQLISTDMPISSAHSLIFMRESDLEKLAPDTREELLNIICKVQQELDAEK